MRIPARYPVTLDCGHEYVYPVTAHPFPGARLHCPGCAQLRVAVFTGDRIAEEPYDWSEDSVEPH